jgi:hypothetical protein
MISAGDTLADERQLEAATFFRMLMLWIGYTKLYRKEEVMVYFEGKERRRKPWLKDEHGGPTARSRRSSWWSCSTTVSPGARSSGNTI